MATCSVCWWASGGMITDADGQVLHQRLDLGRLAGGDGHAAPADPGAVALHADFADGDEDHRQPGQVALHAERDHGGQHARLVGQGVEEGARTGRAVAAGHVAIEPVARGEQEAHDHVDPRGAPGHEHQHVDRRRQQAGHGDGVGRRDQRARAEGELRLRGGLVGVASLTVRPTPRAATGSRSPARTANRSGPSAPVMVTSTRLPTARSSGRCTMPSISGASCTVRPWPGASTRTCAGGADERVPLGGRDGVLQLGALAQAFERELGRHLVARGRRRGCPSSREYGKKPAQSSCAAARNSSRRSWSRSVSPGIAEDEGGAEGGLGARPP